MTFDADQIVASWSSADLRVNPFGAPGESFEAPAPKVATVAKQALTSAPVSEDIMDGWDKERSASVFDPVGAPIFSQAPSPNLSNAISEQPAPMPGHIPPVYETTPSWKTELIQNGKTGLKILAAIIAVAALAALGVAVAYALSIFTTVGLGLLLLIILYHLLPKESWPHRGVEAFLNFLSSLFSEPKVKDVMPLVSPQAALLT